MSKYNQDANDQILQSPENSGIRTWSNTGTPLGTLLLPVYFFLYMADCRSSHDDCITTSYAHDTDKDHNGNKYVHFLCYPNI